MIYNKKRCLNFAGDFGLFNMSAGTYQYILVRVPLLVTFSMSVCVHVHVDSLLSKPLLRLGWRHELSTNRVSCLSYKVLQTDRNLTKIMIILNMQKIGGFAILLLKLWKNQKLFNCPTIVGRNFLTTKIFSDTSVYSIVSNTI